MLDTLLAKLAKPCRFGDVWGIVKLTTTAALLMPPMQQTDCLFPHRLLPLH